MQLINPGIGLVFWMTVAFLMVLFILGKFAWPAILKGLKEREQSIQEALDAAKEAQEQMKRLKMDNEKMLKEAMEERDEILAEARKMKDKIISEAKEKAEKEAAGIVENAKEKINNEKTAALREIKSTVAEYSIEIAEKILREELKDKARQKAYIEKLLEETHLN
ncbi:F0F1 ATP synthase subunit B [Candidatus Sulfidibacterium hydrothermale]|uniref:F0F1 ATP synthase subunit B n=1 Tax=Candidatus Sulfidibacterium hydrothermale TaxID=2875962 RepID=UPI001F0A6E86|nr:F0F1 ATP synthase subunit B [Candidatus Sulfidibacterium hydrothermale]UBM62288.1 F0F1 ATP synthase subunit B [Candidatus Sulfidibacterium hydrothermale]